MSLTPTPQRRGRSLARAVHAPTVHDYARRMALLTELDSQTWVARYSASERLGNPDAVASVAGYLAWLRRLAAAWSTVPMPTVEQAAAVWPFTTLTPAALDATGPIAADLREAALTGGRPRTRTPSARPIATPAPAGREAVDACYVAGAAYLATSVAPEVTVLAADVEHLSATASRTPLPQHYLRHSLDVAAMRGPLRRELAAWAEQIGPAEAERVVLTARMLAEQLSAALVGGSRPGW